MVFSYLCIKIKRRIMRKLLVTLLCTLPIGLMAQTRTLDECQQMAMQNYPLIKRHDLIARTANIDIDNIGKQWLPQVTVYAQATLQSDVVKLPDAMTDMLRQTGVQCDGLKREQYKIGVDVSQIIYDGGAIGRNKEVAARQKEVMTAENEVSLHAVRKRINELYFGVLLVNDLLRLNADRQSLLNANEKQLEAMLKGGTAMECDYNSVRAERLNATQEATNLNIQKESLLQLLSAFIGEKVSEVQKPVMIDSPNDRNNRPEVRLAETQLQLIRAQENALHAGLMPKVSAFASGFYGYPGYNMYEDMMRRRMSLNGIIGLRVTWNIGSLYTNKNDKARLELQRKEASNRLETFLFNNHLDNMQQDAEIERYRKLMATDNEIISLREKVRRAYESKLRHGIIEVTSLLQELNKENGARIALSTHEIELLKHLYDQKWLLGQ